MRSRNEGQDEPRSYKYEGIWKIIRLCEDSVSYSSTSEAVKINVLTLSTDEGQDNTSPTIMKRRRLRWHRSCNSEKVGRLSCSAKITRHSSILKVGKINVLTLSTDEGQDDTSPAILKMWGDYHAMLNNSALFQP
ncbi:hypothetical protein GQ457_14G017920 [Hibiscus cannabinus]